MTTGHIFKTSIHKALFLAFAGASLLGDGAASALPPSGSALASAAARSRFQDWDMVLARDEVAVNDAGLSAYFTDEEIAQYRRALEAADNTRRGGVPGTNRLTDPGHNRCGNDQLPPEQCPRYQQLAYNDGNGCINATEYDFARANAIAPLCSPLDPTVYIGWCRCGCFERSTEIFAFDKGVQADRRVPVAEIEAEAFDLYALGADAELDAPRFDRRAVVATTVGPEEKPLVRIELEDGVVLGLTEQHAVLVSTGEMITAVALDPEQHRLVNEHGESVRIRQIERVATTDDVFNVLTDAGLDHKGHMIVANGLIVGDIMWQNTLAADLGKIVVRM